MNSIKQNNINDLAEVLKKGEFTAGEITKALNLEPRILKLAEVIRKGEYSESDISQAYNLHSAKAQIEDRLLGAMMGWNDKHEIFKTNDLLVRNAVALVAKRITNWLFYNSLINLPLLIAAGPYYPSQPESRPQPQNNDERAVL